MKKIKLNSIKYLCLLVIALFALQSTMPVLAAKEKKVIRVGYVGYDGFITKNRDGAFEGYAVEYLEKIADYTGDSYEYVYCTWEDSLEMLKNHEIDLICSAKLTAQRSKNYEYSRQNFGWVQSVLYTRMNNKSLYYDDHKALNGKKIAMLKGNMNVDLFHEYAKRNHFTYTPMFYETDQEMKEALLRGEVDAMAAEHLVRHNDLRLIGNFGSEPFFLMSYIGNEFLGDMNYALGEINTKDVGYEQKLFDKYYGDTLAGNRLNLTREEAQYLEKCGVIKVGQLPNRYPMSSVMDKQGNLAGITEDILNVLSHISGIEFEFQALAVDEKPIQALKKHQVDMVAGILSTPNFLKDTELRLSDPFLETTLAVVAKKGRGFNKDEKNTVVLKKSFQAMQEYIAQNYPDFQTIFGSNDSECLNAILDGKADIYLQNIYVMNYLLQKPCYERLEMIPTSLFTEENCMATLSSTDPRLMSILNKAIVLLKEESINEIIQANTTAKPYQLTLSDILYKYWVTFLMIGFLIFFSLGMAVIIALNKQNNLKKIQSKNRDLAEAVLQAEQANRAKSQFLSRMSHEIRTPMNAIVGITTIAKHHLSEAEKTEEYLDKINSSSKILLNIINDVLDMSAIENEKLHIAQSPFDLKEILSAISSLYYTQCKEKNITFEMLISNIEHELILGDSLRVNQILLNLISNAYKFTPNGGTIKVVLSETGKNGSKVFLRFIVSDTGIGIAPELMERLFLPFEQENAETAQKHGGSGLGLSITKNLVDLMHGAIKVESQKNKGTTFTVDLPFEMVELKEVLEPEEIKNIKTLVVDDDKDTREYTEIVLNRIGVDFEMVSSGEEAVERLTQAFKAGHKYDLCLVDWKMPGLNGIDVTRRIRELFNKETVVIMISAYDLSEVEEEAKEAGADLFVTKPLFQSTIFNVLSSLCGGNFRKKTVHMGEYDFSGHRVLLAEDNELNTEIAVELLNMVQMEVDTAQNGEEAVAKFIHSQPGTYDAILMDIQMPIMDGHEAARMIRKATHPQSDTIPILAMTANAFTEDVTSALSSGMNGHIAKPIDTAILYETLRKYIG